MKGNKKIFMILIAIFVAIIASSAVKSQDYYWDEGDAEAFAFLGLGLFVCIPLAWFIIAILIAIWVYRDAERRGSSGVLWLIIVFFLGIIGLIIWLVVRPPLGGNQPSPGVGTAPPSQTVKGEPDRRCPNCGRAIPNDARVCPYCAKNFEG